MSRRHPSHSLALPGLPEAVVPLAGFNVRGVPVRIELNIPEPRPFRRCAMEPCENPAEVIFGARPHCLSCANEARAFLFGREGEAAVRAAVVP